MRYEQINAESRLQEDLNLDSLDQYEVLMACEDEFSLSIERDDSFLALKTAGDVTAFITKERVVA